jgi:formylglycine-generating enzyme required for sulfatase activity
VLEDFVFDEKMQRLYENEEWREYFKRREEKFRQLPVLRGGSWYNDCDFCRCAVLNNEFPYYWLNIVNFRCARI